MDVKFSFANSIEALHRYIESKKNYKKQGGFLVKSSLLFIGL